jgi:gliding motility-associated-like protein
MLANLFTLENRCENFASQKRNKLNTHMYKLKHLILTIAVLFTSAVAFAQNVVLVVSTPEVCSGNQSIFFATVNNLSGKTVSTYEWTASGNAPVTNTQSNFIFAYAPGNYTMTVKVNFSDGSSVTSSTVNFTVFHLPVPAFTVNTNTVQCFRGNFFVFTNNSSQNPATPSNPISHFIIGYGDGIIDSFGGATTTFTHSYNAANQYTPFIEVTDIKGCKAQQFLTTNAIVVKPNISPDFRWVMTSGPCFTSCYRFTNISLPSVNAVSSYRWDFGDGTVKSFNTATNKPNYDTITHCYTKNGQFNPALVITDTTNCIDSTRKTPSSTTIALPQNIRFEFDVVTFKGGTGANRNDMKDSVCVQSGSAGNICFKMTPISFASPGTGDFVWNFGDPNDPTNRNLDSNSWEPCHAYSGMGHFVPRITIKNVCPDTTFIFHSAVSTYSVFDSIINFPDMDYGPNMTPPPPLNSVGYNLPAPVDFTDSVDITLITPWLMDTINNNGPVIPVFGYTVTTTGLPISGDTVFFRQTFPVVDGSNNLLSSTRIPSTMLVSLEYINYVRKLKPALSNKSDSFVYAFKTKFERPIFYFAGNNPMATYPAGHTRSKTLVSWHLLNALTKRGYGVFVTGPFARIENPPAMILLAPNHKRQCGPRDTVDFRNTQVNYKSRKTWRRWDFDDNFAPQCTSYALPRNGNRATIWPDAISQDRGSFHFFYQNGRMYPGRVHCKFSHDTLPRHYYPAWDSVYLWYRYGKDFFPWDATRFTLGTPTPGQQKVAPWDAGWWGAPVYLNILTGEWSKTQDSTFLPYYIYQRTYFDSVQNRNITVDEAAFVNEHDTLIKKRWYAQYIDTTRTLIVNNINGLWYKWPRIDSMDFRQNQGQDFADTFNQITMQNVPDPIAIGKGKYPYVNYNLNGNINKTWSVTQSSPDGDLWSLTPTTLLPNGDSMYQYAFRRSIQRCLTVRQRIRDSANNETTDPGAQYDALMLDNFDCNGEGTVQLAFGQGDGYGLGLSGKICPGSSSGNFGAQIRFNMGQIGRYPGVVPNCGQSFILMNLDSLADRRDATPCDIDGFTTFTGGVTPGLLSRPNFNTLVDYNPNPPGPWMNPNGTVNVYHYDPFHPVFPTPLPADQEGWVTIGVAIGNGSKDTIRTNVFLSQYKANPAAFQIPITAPVQNPVGGIPITGSAGAFNPGQNYTYNFSHVFNYRPITTPVLDTLIDIVYIDNNYPKCVSSVVWYHRFFRLINITASFQMFPEGCWHRGKNDSVTVFYNDSIQDSIKYSVWAWADGTATVDSFWYSGDNRTDGFFDNGVRRVRYNWDLLENRLMDSTVWPIRASGIGATDGLRPRQKFAIVPYDTLDFCTNTRIPNPPTYIADTALMFLPIFHKYVRSSWEASGRNENSAPTSTVHLITTTADCQSREIRLTPIGVIDTFETRRGSHTGPYDNVFCENEAVYFYDSVRYWRYDCQQTVLPDNPGRSKPRVGQSPIVFDPATGDPRSLLQMDPYDFWREAEFNPNVIKDSFTVTKVFWNLFTNSWDTLKRRGAVFAEKMYWNFGDGNTYIGTRPVHRYNGFGRYKVTMITMDSLGWFDTCEAWVNIVQPVARIYTPQTIYGCGDITSFVDTSYIDFGTGPSTTDAILTNYWWFGENKADTLTPVSINRKNVSWLYRSNGPFTLKLVVETEQGCFDTTYQDIFIQGPRPRFRLLTDTLGCAPMKVKIINLADSAGGISPSDTPTAETIVYWGDGNISIVGGRRDTVEYTYTNEGSYSIIVAGRDTKTPDPVVCNIVYFPDTLGGLNKPVNIFVFKYPVSITGDRRYICVGDELEITNTSDSNFTAFRYYIYDDLLATTVDSFDVSGPATAGNPIITSRQFDTEGDYQVISSPTSFSSNVPVAAYDNCRITDTLAVTVSTAVADFTVDSAAIPLFKFTNASTNAVRYDWTLLDQAGELIAQKAGTISDPNFEYDLGENKGTYTVCLIAYTADSLGACPDTVCNEIVNQFTTDIKLYNVFSPNGDNSNELFIVDVEGVDEYEILIFNRWGGKVFESTDSKKHWNGKTNNDGSECPAGVYYYIINYKLKAQDAKTVNGTVTLIR